MTMQSALNDRQELFCQEYVRRPVGRSAAAAAGYEQGNSAAQACRLLARDDIRARIAQLRANIARQQCREADTMLAKLESIFELAIIDHQYGTAVRAVTLQARIAGLLPGSGSREDALRDAAEAVAAEAHEQPAPVPESVQESAPMPINANECEDSGVIPPLPDPAMDVPASANDPAPMHTDANRCEQIAERPVAENGIVAQWASGRKRRTLSGRRK